MDHLAKKDEQTYDNEFSRLIATLGKEALQKLQSSKILLAGLNGLGAEIAKNIVLMGVKSLTLHDPETVTLNDLASQFFFSETDVGKNRASVSLPKIQELNERVEVQVCDELTEATLATFTVVVLADVRSRAEMLRINTFCHQNNIAFIAGGSWGLFGWAFSDFGPKFMCIDSNGEQPRDAYIEGITKSEEGVISIAGKRHDLEDGDVIRIEEVEGMTQINGREWTVKVPGPFTLSIGDTREFDNYTKGGRFIQVKVPKALSFKPLSDFLGKAPSYDHISLGDGNKFMRMGQYGYFLEGIFQFIEEKGRFPTPGSATDAKKITDFANAIAKAADPENLNFDEETTKWMETLAKGTSGVISPMASVFGGILGQEIIKATSSKYTPLQQFFFFDAQECLPETPELNEAECAPRNTRYDSQIAVFGNTFNDKILNLRYFLVGAGAIGCEVLKCWAMMGVGAGPNGHVDITDMDTIEVSNLNRQFLYRPHDVAHAKSEVAARAMKRMNPAMKIDSWTTRVGPESENTYDDKFFNALDGVCNALDNVQARLYMDGRCVFYGLSLLESGTQGTKGNVQVIVPYLTESYGASVDPPSQETPVCLLHSFPNNIQHCLQYAREILFEGSFVLEPEVTNKFIEQPDYLSTIVPTARITTLKSLENTILLRPKTFEDCVRWARCVFEERFVIQIENLLFNFPRDYVDQHGAPFWSGAKRPPTPLVFSVENSAHMDFIISATFLKAYVCGLLPNEFKPSPAEMEEKVKSIKSVAAATTVPKFVPKKMNIITDEKITKPVTTFTDEEEEKSKTIISQLPAPQQVQNLKMTPVVFEKDDDRNFHIDFIAAASNLRAMNYAIPTASRLDSKLIAGKIIPAIVTTTACVVGFVNLEFYKLQCGDRKTKQGQKKLEDYKNTFVNLALPLVQQSDPLKPKTMKYNNKEFTLWDRIDIRLGDATLQQVMDFFEKEHGLEITMLGVGQLLAYVGFNASAKERRKMKITDIVELVSKKKLDPQQKFMFLDPTCCSVETGDDVEDLPTVCFWYKD